MTGPLHDPRDPLPEELQAVANAIPAIPNAYTSLRALLSLLPNPLAARTQPSFPVGDLTAPPQPLAQQQQQTLVGNGPGTMPGTDIMPGSITGGVAIAPGSLPATTFDVTPPAVPTGLALTSDVGTDANGQPIVRLIATLTHPTDVDYFGSYIEVTRDNDGNDVSPSPVWTQPMKLLLGKESTKVAFEGVFGNTVYWARAFSVDFQGNKSAYTSTISATTAKDTTIPSIPGSLAATGGFRGVGLSWAPPADVDISGYQYRYSTNGGTTWDSTIATRATKVWVDLLTPGVTYTFQVQSVDFSGNVSGFSGSVTAVPTSVGTADIAAGSITAALINAAGISADSLTAGTITIKPSGGAVALQVKTAGGALAASWDPTNGIQIFNPSVSGDFAQFNSGTLSFYKAGVLTAQLSPSGILADSLRLGTLAGGHNVILNSSFELAAFVTGAASIVFTNNSGTPGWKAANRITALDNITENANDLTAVVSF